MIGALHLALAIAVPMQAAASAAVPSIQVYEYENDDNYVYEYEYLIVARAHTRPRSPTRPLKDEWLGNDKLRHFLISMAVTQFTYGGLRTASTNDDVALSIAIGVAAVGSVGKEVHDIRNDGTFSLKDLAWDAAGIAVAGILLGSIR